MSGVELSTHRIEALCDGVFAIAMTLLVFQIRLPGPDDMGAARAFRALWPSLASYAASFAVLGVYWVGQHTQFHFIRHADQVLIWMTLGFLMLIAAIPFSASLLSRYDFARWTVIVYGCHLILIGSTHYLVWRYVSHRSRLLGPHADAITIGVLRRVSLRPLLVYVAAVAFSFVNPYVSVLAYAVVPVVLIVRAVMPEHRGGSG